MIGQPMPLMPMEHQYARTNSLKALEPFKDTEIALPMLREQDHSLYFRQHHQEWGIKLFSPPSTYQKPETQKDRKSQRYFLSVKIPPLLWETNFVPTKNAF